MEDYSCRFDRTRDRRWDFRLRAAGQDGRGFGPRWWPSAEDISALSGARIAALHAGLKLNAEQEKNWPLVKAALRDLAEQRADCSLRAPAPTVRRISSSG